MKGSESRRVLRAVVATVLMSVASAGSFAQSVRPAVTLERQAVSEIRMEGLPEAERKLAARLPEGFYEFGAGRVGETADVQALTLKFAAGVKLVGITSAKDFTVEPGGSCVEGDVYEAGASCRLLVRFTPQGPGHRFGRMSVEYSGARPLSLGLTGYGYAPVASFTPAVITTVPGSYPSGNGLFSGAANLDVDDGDSLYVADTGNNVVRYLNSGGTFQTVPTIFEVTAPVGVTVDDLGSVYITQDSPAALIESQFNSASYYASGTGTCAVGATCPLYQQKLNDPGALAFDHNGGVFMAMPGAPAKLTNQALGDGFLAELNITPLTDEFLYSGNSAPTAMTVDGGDNIYSFENINVTNACTIVVQSLYSAENSLGEFAKVAGGNESCGFSGDGGEARNAEIGTAVGQMAFDIAGNLYLSDTSNQRVRRIDATTGIINTIAGNGAAGYAGDGGPATKAELAGPTGVGVDSQGQVYILSGTAAKGSAQVVRKLGPNGELAFGNQLKGTASAAMLATLANTGNDEMVFTRVFVSGTNPGDFSIDPNTTSCLLTAGSVLGQGQSCKVGVIFDPAAAGSRSANLVFLDNTVTNSNVVQLTGTGALVSPTMAITAPASGATETVGTAFPFTVTVTSTSSPAPTGTVKFTLNGSAIGGPVTLVSGTATVSVKATATGTATLAAVYSGDGNYASAGPVTRTVTVDAAKVKAVVDVKAKANPATTCEGLVFSAEVTGEGTVKPTGEVELKEGGKVLTEAKLSNGVATLTSPKLAAGVYSLTASYLGDATHAESTSAPLKETVVSGTCLVPRTGSGRLGWGPIPPGVR